MVQGGPQAPLIGEVPPDRAGADPQPSGDRGRPQARRVHLHDLPPAHAPGRSGCRRRRIIARSNSAKAPISCSCSRSNAFSVPERKHSPAAETLSSNTRSAPLSSWRSSDWSWLETRLYPILMVAPATASQKPLGQTCGRCDFAPAAFSAPVAAGGGKGGGDRTLKAVLAVLTYYAYNKYMKLEWDEAKRQRTLQTRGLDFADVMQIEWETAISFDDDREDYGEERWVCLGLLRGQWVVVAYTFRGDALRVISMRKASRRERRMIHE